MQNKEIAEELHKTIIRKFEKRKAHPSFLDKIWGADLVQMQPLSKCNKIVCYLLCVIDIYSKYTWVTPLKNRKGITITSAFQKILHESRRKANKIWVYKGSKFTIARKPWLEKNDTETY